VTGIPSVGLPLDHLAPPALVSSLARGFGHSLGHVSLHTDDASGRAAANIDARAFTVGSDIYFGSREYHPQSPSGIGLLAH
jgi:hypothetical protein